MDQTHLGIISSTDLIDAKFEEHQMCKSRQCPGCGHKLDSKPDWLALPAGVKFDPTDQELIDHLEAKVEGHSSKSHPLIDEFIPTIEGEDGICYTHPEKLPGVTKDGLSRHFFHRPSKAYTTGTRKRRKIQTECDLQGGETRWHKTGKTRSVMVNGKQKGCKKILVLYTNFGKHKKPEKTNWVMHHYHLGLLEEEKEGELVVSKIFYQTQPRQCNNGSERSTEIVATQKPTSSSSQTGDCSGAVNVISNRCTTTVLCEEHEQMSASPSSRSLHMSHEQQQQQQQQQQVSNASFHISRPSNPISTIVSPTLDQTTMVINDTFHVSRLLLQNENFQQKTGDGSAGSASHKISSLEELFMQCTPADIKQESAMPNVQETEWLKYSFWSDPDHHM